MERNILPPAVYKELCKTFPVTAGNRSPKPGEITVFPAGKEIRILSTDEFDLSETRLMVFDGDGKICGKGTGFRHDPEHTMRSPQRKIEIPANGFCTAYTGKAGEIDSFYNISWENTWLCGGTLSPAGADLHGSYQNGKLTLHFRPEKEIPGGGHASFLFVGNSATYIASIPLIFKYLARATGRNVSVEFCTFGGATLMEYADENHDYGKTLRNLLNHNKYEFIVLQDAGRTPSANTHKALETLPPARPQKRRFPADLYALFGLGRPWRFLRTRHRTLQLLRRSREKIRHPRRARGGRLLQLRF